MMRGGQGLSLPLVLRWANWDGVEPDADEVTFAREQAYQAGLDEVARARPNWPTSAPVRPPGVGLRDRGGHLATENPVETEERRQERVEHDPAGRHRRQREAVIEPRDRGEINDQTLRTIERELDLEELRMEV
jgi:monovalent cation/hydrogen antiporter